MNPNVFEKSKKEGDSIRVSLSILMNLDFDSIPEFDNKLHYSDYWKKINDFVKSKGKQLKIYNAGGKSRDDINELVGDNKLFISVFKCDSGIIPLISTKNEIVHNPTLYDDILVEDQIKTKKLKFTNFIIIE